MNIFAKVIFTTNSEIAKKLITNQNLTKKDDNESYEIYFKTWEDFHIVLVNQKDKNFEKSIEFVTSNFEVTNFYNIWTALSLDSVDLQFWDVVVPNAILNEKNEVIFIENYIDKNYDLNKFGLVLNWMCVSLEKSNEDDEKLLEIKENFSADIFDFESFDILNTAKKYNLENKICLVKVITNTEENLENWCDILEFLM